LWCRSILVYDYHRVLKGSDRVGIIDREMGLVYGAKFLDCRRCRYVMVEKVRTFHHCAKM